MPPSSYDPAALLRLGQAIRSRREALGLDVRRAVALAPDDKGRPMGASTWSKIENGKINSYPSTYARIEKVLGWVRGACKATLDGGDPTVATDDGRQPVLTEITEPGAQLMVIVAGWAELPASTRQRILDIATAAHEAAHIRKT